jgi:hypothetical protein
VLVAVLVVQAQAVRLVGQQLLTLVAAAVWATQVLLVQVAMVVVVQVQELQPTQHQAQPTQVAVAVAVT